MHACRTSLTAPLGRVPTPPVPAGALLYAQQQPHLAASCTTLDGFMWWLSRAGIRDGVPAGVPLLAIRNDRFLHDADEYLSCNAQLTQQLCDATQRNHARGAAGGDAAGGDAASGHANMHRGPAGVDVASAVLSGLSHFDYTDMSFGAAPWLLRAVGLSALSSFDGVTLQSWLARATHAFILHAEARTEKRTAAVAAPHGGSDSDGDSNGGCVSRLRAATAYEAAAFEAVHVGWEAEARGGYLPFSHQEVHGEEPADVDDDGVAWTKEQRRQLAMLLQGARSASGLGSGLFVPPEEPDNLLVPYLLSLRQGPAPDRDELARELAVIFNSHSEAAVRYEIDRLWGLHQSGG